MPRINLTGGSYVSRAASVSAQRCLNLYPEPVPQPEGEPIQYTHFPTPGLRSVYSPDVNAVVRCLYTTSQGDLIAVIGARVVHVDAGGNANFIGLINDGVGQVRIQDNGLVVFIVDGDYQTGWYFSMPSDVGQAFGGIIPIGNDPAYYGSTTIAILDQFLLFVQPNSRHWYVGPQDFTDWNTQNFNSLYIATKAAYPDQVMGIAVIGQTIWIFGKQTTEQWYNSGAPDFPFARQPSVLAEQGCESPYSIATTAGQVFWVSRDRAGHARVYIGEANQAQPISNFAIESALNSYGDLSSSIGHTYQQDGHVCYVLTIPSVGKTWVYDGSTQLWHERCSLDSNGNEARYRANCWASAYGRVFCGDYQNGTIYEVSAAFPDEDGNPVKRQRGLPHLLTNGTRAIHRQLMLDVQNGSGLPVQVDWSDDRGATYVNAIPLTLGTAGNAWPTIWRLGLARDRVYRLTWTDQGTNTVPALMGVFLNADPVRT